MRVQDKEFGKKIIEGLRFLDDLKRVIGSEVDGENYIVEAFDQPLVAQMVFKNPWLAEFPYGVKLKLDLENLLVDEWDRFHGRTEKGIPFVFSRKAQNEFFNSVEEFSDEGFNIGETFYEVRPYWSSHVQEGKSETWTKRYQNAEDRWDLKTENPILKNVIPQLKIPKSRVLVLGCGRGHDASYLARLGNVVTAVDFSEAAIADAKNLYAENENLKFIQANVFDLPDTFLNKYDVVFEHTLFCAIDPIRRNELIKIYKSCLNEHGHLLAIFFTIENMQGPPFGATEWELKQRLKKYFQNLYWTRSKVENARTLGSELIVYARKI